MARQSAGSCRPPCVNARSVKPQSNADLSVLGRTAWSPRWQADFLAAARRLAADAEERSTALAQFEELIGRRFRGNAEQAKAAIEAAIMLAGGGGPACGLAPEAEPLMGALEAAVPLLSARNERIATLSVRYKGEATTIELDALRLEWTNASNAWVVKRALATKKVKRALAGVAVGTPSAPLEDIDALIDIRRLEQQIADLDPVATAAGSLWRGVDTDVGQLGSAIEWCRRARSVIATLDPDPDGFSELLSRFWKLLCAPELIRLDGPFGRVSARLARSHSTLASSLHTARELAAAESLGHAENHPEWLANLVRLADQWISGSV
jgi:hypothetical protein